jgi:hypothetical protein
VQARPHPPQPMALQGVSLSIEPIESRVKPL